MTIAFTVPGPAVAKERPRHGGVHVWTPQRTKDFETDVAWSAKVARAKPNDGEIVVTLRFFGCRGDWDNLSKSVCDALNGIAYRDDRQIIEAHVFVDRHGTPARTEIEIRPKETAA